MNKKRFVVVACLGIAALPTTGFTGPTIYSYTGVPYSSVPDFGGIPGNYDTSMQLAGSIRFAEALEPNTDYASLAATPPLVSYSFNDGRITYTNQNTVSANSNFVLSTGASGGIDAWHISLFRAEPIQGTDAATVVSGSVCAANFCDQANLQITFVGADIGQSTAVGTWTAAPVPEPSMYALMLAGIALVGWAARRRIQPCRVTITIG